MHRHDQIELLKRLLHYIDTRTTSMADAPWRNDVSVYTDTKHLAQEQQILFRQHPILMGFASEWAKPGDFRTDDYVGVPVLIVRGRDGKLRAFLNVCRHRGAKVAEGCGTARLFCGRLAFGTLFLWFLVLCILLPTTPPPAGRSKDTVRPVRILEGATDARAGEIPKWGHHRPFTASAPVPEPVGSVSF